jgi:hypothetical protein
MKNSQLKYLLLYSLLISLFSFNDSYSQYSSGKDLIIIVPQNENILAPLPLYKPDFNGMNNLMNQRSYNYEQELKRRKAVFDSMTSEEQKAYIAQIKAEQEQEKADRIQQMKFEQKNQRITFLILGAAALTYFFLSE